MAAPHASGGLPAEADPPLCSTSTLARILDLQPLPDAGDGLLRFRGLNLREGTYWPRVFGGQLIGQALVAASRSPSLPTRERKRQTLLATLCTRTSCSQETRNSLSFTLSAN